MNAWTNIEVSPHDSEIVRINELEARLGELPDDIHVIRELITRHEACHFKSKQHIQKIQNSILHLEPCINPNKIGINHIQHGEIVWKKDSTGRSFVGQQYVWAIGYWLGNIQRKEVTDIYDEKLVQHVSEILGDNSEEKNRLVRLLLARLTWDWKNYEKFQQGGEYKELKFQICRMDICHYSFPENLNRLLIGIGKMKPVENFEGCGSYNNNIRKFIENKWPELSELFHSFYKKSDTKNQTKAWLTACLMKTLKEQVEVSKPLNL